MDIEIRKIFTQEDISAALKLSERVFMEYEAPIYPEEGKDSFLSFLYGENMERMCREGTIDFFGAFEGVELIGVCAARNQNHITLMFVEGSHHKKGVGRALMEHTCNYITSAYDKNNVTLNSSPYGKPFYEKLGFIATDMEKMEDGIIYTPMLKIFPR